MIQIFLIFISSVSFAQFDYNADASAQTYPSGGTVTATAGYGKELWRSAEQPESGPAWKYGYLRPTVEFKSAAVVNRLTAAMDFYPISIFGISAGAGVDQRNYNDFNDIDCKAVLCDKALQFKFYKRV